jgi:predicted  nucleic acid-binding Zn-ribbon protein
MAQISSLKTRISDSDAEPGSTSKVSSALNARASNAERRLAATQKQLEAAKEKLDEAQCKVSAAEEKWAARLCELEAQLRVAQEKAKRERQSARERVADLVESLECVLWRLIAVELV